MDSLPTGTSMGVVDLLVRDLDLMVAYYTEGVGLDVLQEGGDVVVLGRRSAGAVTPILRLTSRRDLPAFNRGDAGLFHTAILFDTKADLANALLSTVRHRPTSFTGSADHLVSEAFYFDDPEGNGLELYTDRPRESWTVMDGGRVKMATLPLDPNAYLEEHLPAEAASSRGSSVGHVHLQVGDVAEAESFYADVLGFDVTARYGDQALFVAADGYHHHLGLNTWNSRGAGPRAASLGLERLAIDVATADDLAAIKHRLDTAGLESELRSDDGAGGTRLLTADPWGTRIEILAGV